MNTVIRLFVTPAAAGGMTYFVASHLFPLELPGHDANWWLALVVLLPVTVTFFSQLHRLDVHRRLEELENKVDRLMNQSHDRD